MRPHPLVFSLLLAAACGRADTRSVTPNTLIVGNVGCDVPGAPLAQASELARAGRLRAALRSAAQAPAACAKPRDALVAHVRADLESAAPTRDGADAEIARAALARARGDEVEALRALDRAWSALARSGGEGASPITPPPADAAPSLSSSGKWLLVGDASIEVATGKAFAGRLSFVDAAETRALVTTPGTGDDDPVRVRVVEVSTGRVVLDRMAAREPLFGAHAATLILESPDGAELAFASTETGAVTSVPVGGEIVRRIFHGEVDAYDRDILEVDPRTFAWVTEGDTLHVRSLDEPAERTFVQSGATITAVALETDLVAIAWSDGKARVHRRDGTVVLAVSGVQASAVAPLRDALAYADGDSVIVVDARGKRRSMPIESAGFGSPRALAFAADGAVRGYQQSGDIWCTVDYDLKKKRARMLSSVTPGTDFEQGRDDGAFCARVPGARCENPDGYAYLPRSGHEALVTLEDAIVLADDKTAAVRARYGSDRGCGAGKATFDAATVACVDAAGAVRVIRRSGAPDLRIGPLGCALGMRLLPAEVCDTTP